MTVAVVSIGGLSALAADGFFAFARGPVSLSSNKRAENVVHLSFPSDSCKNASAYGSTIVGAFFGETGTGAEGVIVVAGTALWPLGVATGSESTGD